MVFDFHLARHKLDLSFHKSEHVSLASGKNKKQYGSPPECSFKANFMQFSKLI